MFEMHCSKLQKEERNSISSTEKPSNANTLAPLSSMSEVSTMTALSSIGRKHMVLTLSSQGNITTADLRSIAFMGVRPLTERMRLACRLGLWCAGAHILGRFKQAMSIRYCNIEIFQLSRSLVEDWRIKKAAHRWATFINWALAVSDAITELPRRQSWTPFSAVPWRLSGGRPLSGSPYRGRQIWRCPSWTPGSWPRPIHSEAWSLHQSF